MSDVSIGAELALDTSGALSGLDEIDARLEAVAQSFSVGLADAVSQLSAEAVDVPVTAETDAAEAALAALSDEAVDVTVTADVGDAESAISGLSEEVADLGESGQQASGGIDSAAGSAAAFGAASGLARGNARGLLGPLAAAGPAGVAAAAGIGASVAVLGELFAIGTRATSAQERFNLILGDSAARVDAINVGDLNTDIAGLADASASGGAGMRNAAADFFLFAQAGGLAADQAELTTQRILALAARISVLNPALGETGEVAARLPRALAGSARLAAQFGLNLTTVSVAAEAARLGLADANGEFTRAALVAAGASLAMQQIGGTLSTDIAAGSENAAVQLRAVSVELRSATAEAGKPLVAPILDLLEAATPFAVSLGQAFAALGGVAIPALTVALSVLAPAVAAFARGFDLATPALLAYGAFVLLTNVIPALTTALTFLAAHPAVAAAAAIGLVVTALGFIAGPADTAADSLHGTQAALDAATQSAQSLVQTLASSGQAAFVDQVLRQIIDISPEVNAAITDMGFSVAGLVDQIQSGLSVSAPGETLDQLVEASGLTGDAADEARAALAELAYQVSISANGAEALAAAQERNAEAAAEGAGSLDAEAAAMQDVADAASEARAQLDLLTGTQRTMDEAAIALQETSDALVASVLSGGRTFDIASEAGRENTQNYQAQAEAVANYTLAVASQTGSVTEASAAQRFLIADLRQTGIDSGLTEAQIERNIETYARVPRKLITDTAAPGAVAARNQLREVDRAARSIPGTVSIFVQVDTSTARREFEDLVGDIARATGEPIESAPRTAASASFGAVSGGVVPIATVVADQSVTTITVDARGASSPGAVGDAVEAGVRRASRRAIRSGVRLRQ